MFAGRGSLHFESLHRKFLLGSFEDSEKFSPHPTDLLDERFIRGEMDAPHFHARDTHCGIAMTFNGREDVFFL